MGVKPNMLPPFRHPLLLSERHCRQALAILFGGKDPEIVPPAASDHLL